MQIIIQLPLVTEFFPDQMPSVGGGINQDVGRLLLQPAFDNRLQVLIFDFKILKAQVIHIDDKLIIPVFNLADHIIQILELVLIYLNDAQPL